MPANRSVRLIGSLALATACLAATNPADAGTISPALKSAIAQAGPDGFVPVVVLMNEFPDQAILLTDVRRLTRANRRARVVSTMKSLADRSQAPVREILADAAEEARDMRVLWGINGIALEATPATIDRLAALPEVREVLYDRATRHPDVDGPVLSRAGTVPAEGTPENERTDGRGPTGGDTSGPNPDADVAGDLVAMSADRVWNELGYTGAGVIVGVIDTGLDPEHPDLADHIWTNLGEVPNNGIDDDGNGHIDDTWGWDFCADTPPVIDSHGTQVAGQVAGDGTNGLVTGMAPDAELMSLGIDCDTPSRAWEASDYALTHGAHVLTQSYSWWWTDRPDYEAFRRQTDVELAAGVLHVNSGGNSAQNFERPIPYNISTPANCPAPWTHPDQTLAGGVSSMIAVGNIHWGTDVIDSSSSRGPSAWEDIRANTDPTYPYTMAPEYQDYPYENGAQMGLIKPDVSAYGSGTTSTCPGTGYCGFSGTSSAAPHVSGTVALMLQAYPEATPAQLAEALMTTTEHRGDPGKNNVYGTGLVQTFDAVDAVETGVTYASHSIDDTGTGNGDLMLDPGETVVMQITVRSVTDDVAISGVEGILSTATPGVTIHDGYATYPTIAPHGFASSAAPHYSLTIAPGLCSTIVAFELELRYDGVTRRLPIYVRVGEPEPVVLLSDDFETDLGWTSDPVVSTQGAWVREDPIGVQDGQSRFSNPENDTSPGGNTCWVTGNGELTGKKDENNNDVDGGQVILLSPPFGVSHLLSLDLRYDRWFYDVESGNRFRVEASNDGGQTWLLLEERIFGYGGWETIEFDLFALFPPSDDMRLRFVADDDSTDDPVEGAVDEVHLDGVFVSCQEYSPSSALAPNPVGDTLAVDADPSGHAALSWSAPPVDAGHDTATLYRIHRAVSPAGPFSEAGTSTTPTWVDVDALGATDSFYYKVIATNEGGTE